MMTAKIVGCLIALVLAVTAFGQEPIQKSNNTADQTLRSSGRVNPSTLGMEFDLPLGSYPGRGISLPLGLSYSSKQWRLEEYRTIPQANGSNHSWTNPLYSTDAAAGWTSSLSQPYIEYTGEKYRFDASKGFPLSLDEVIPPGTPPRSGDAYIKRITVFLPGGASHELRAQDAPIGLSIDTLPPDSAWNATFYATDGSGLKYVQDSTANPAVYRLYLPDGSQYDFNTAHEFNSPIYPMRVRYAHKLADVHGNYVQYNAPNETAGYPYGSWSDQLGRTFPIMIPRTTPEMPSGETVLSKSFTLPGMSASYTLKWKKLKGDTAATSAFTDFSNQELRYWGGVVGSSTTYVGGPSLFGASTEYRCGSGQTVWTSNPLDSSKFNPVVLTEVILPSGAAYTFSYNEFGEIERINYPTGGREDITYNEIPALAELTGAYKKTNRGVVEHEIYESDSDSTADTWTFSAAVSANNYRTSVTAPDGTQTDRFMHRGAPPGPCIAPLPDQPDYYYGTRWGYDNILAGMPYEERVFSSGTPKHILQRTLTKWTATTTSTLMRFNSSYMQRNARVVSIESITYDGDAGLSAASKVEHDTDVDDFGSPQNTIRSKEYAYKVVSGGNGFSAGEAPPASAVTVTDPTTSATLVRISETDFLNTSTDSNLIALKVACAANNMLKVPIASRVRNASGTIVSQTLITYDQPGSSPALGRGLPTSIAMWNNATTPVSYIITSAAFDTYGNPISATDAKGSITTTQYDPTFHAFPIEVNSPIPDGMDTHGSNTALITKATFNTVTGQPLTTIDANNKTTTMVYDANTLRPISVQAPNGHMTVYDYGIPGFDGRFDLAQRFVKVRSQIDETDWSESYSWSDGLGRSDKSQKVDSNGDIFTEFDYDPMGRVKKASNPYRIGETVLKTENFYDDLGRVIKVKTPDNAEIETSYGLATTGSQIGTVITVEDQADKQRRSITNAQGHLLRVDEPTDAGGLGAINAPNQPTVYAYDLLDNLTTVTQGSQVRNFTYSSLSRLLTAFNPESGTISYQYDHNGNLTQKSQLRSIGITIATNYTYDAMNRVIQRSYTGEAVGYTTPTVKYYYDKLTNARGSLIKVYSTVSTTEYSGFDIMGRPTAHKQTTDGTEYATAYSYNLSGAMIEETYPSTRKVKTVLDNDGAVSAVQSKKNSTSGPSWDYAQNFTYNAAGAVTSMQLGNGHWESAQFNNRLQTTRIALGKTAGAVDLLKLDYSYGTTANNGNIQAQTITVPTVGVATGFTAVQNYTYDSLNRLLSADEKPQGWANCTSDPTKCWKQTFTYDRHGNRRFDETNTTMPASFATPAVTNPTISATNNRLTSAGYAYDTAGNLTADAVGHTYLYDAENKQIQVKNSSGVTLGQYFYDGDDRRVKKVVPNGETTIFVYDASGKLVAEYSTLLNPTPQVSYLTNDHLGSPRVNTDQNGAVISRHDYQPFGEESTGGARNAALGYAGDDNRRQFTGYERDDESGLDFAQARYYSKSLGRFNSADEPFADQTEDNPQSWSLYSYVRNNPLNLVDPSGMAAGCPDKAPAGCYERDGLYYHLVDGEEEQILFVKTVEERPSGGGPLLLMVRRTGRLNVFERGFSNIGSWLRRWLRPSQNRGAPLQQQPGGRPSSQQQPVYGPPSPPFSLRQHIKQLGRQIRGKFPSSAKPNEVLYRADGSGKITYYQTYDNAGLPVKRVDLVGASHGGIPTPHVQEFGRNTNSRTGQEFVNRGITRPALPSEIP